MDFETKLKELEAIAVKMENADTTLDQSIALFNEGVEKTKDCMRILKETEGKIALLVQEADGITEENLELK